MHRAWRHAILPDRFRLRSLVAYRHNALSRNMRAAIAMPGTPQSACGLAVVVVIGRRFVVDRDERKLPRGP
jgi:hypothetical protein